MKKKLLKLSGVTLVEIIIATAIAGIVMTAVAMIFYYSTKASNQGFSQGEAQQAVTLALDNVIKDLHTTGYRVSTDTCGFSKEDCIRKASTTEMILYGDFEKLSVEDPNIPSTTRIELIYYRLVANNTCLLKLIYQEDPDNTWNTGNPPIETKVLIGNNRPSGDSRVIVGTFELTYWDAQRNELVPAGPAGLDINQRRLISRVDVSIEITDPDGDSLSYGRNSSGSLRNLNK